LISLLLLLLPSSPSFPSSSSSSSPVSCFSSSLSAPLTTSFSVPSSDSGFIFSHLYSSFCIIINATVLILLVPLLLLFGRLLRLVFKVSLYVPFHFFVPFLHHHIS